MNGLYRVLLVEDCVADAFLNVRGLARGGFKVESERVETAVQMKAALEATTWDFILCDSHLPKFDGLAALALYKESGLDIPFIVVSGKIGEEQAVNFIKAGAHDYVMKDNLAQLGPAVKRELEAAQERCIRRRTQETQSFLASLVEGCDDAIIGETLEGTVVSWNAGAERLFGYTASEIMGGPVSLLVPSYRPAERPGILDQLKRGYEVAHYETVRQHKNGTPVEVSLTISPIRDLRGGIIGASTVAHDLTRRKEEENERLGLIQELTAALAQTGSRSSIADTP
jgi:PAS domain S-box-containing protein